MRMRISSQKIKSSSSVLLVNHIGKADKNAFLVLLYLGFAILKEW